MKKNFYFSIICLVILVFLSVFAPILTSFSPTDIDLYNISVPPNKIHILGTDELGRDIFSRLLYSGRVSLLIGSLSAIIQVTLGFFIGGLSGYFGGKIDTIFMRFTDAMMCFPFFLLAISLTCLVGPGLLNIILIIGFTMWTSCARILRSEVLKIKQMDFITLAHFWGLSDFRIITKHIFPNLINSVVVIMVIAIAESILAESALSFLGLGVDPNTPTWGMMLNNAQNMQILQYEPWQWIPAGIFIFLTVLNINLLGESIQSYFEN